MLLRRHPVSPIPLLPESERSWFLEICGPWLPTLLFLLNLNKPRDLWSQRHPPIEALCSLHQLSTSLETRFRCSESGGCLPSWGPQPSCGPPLCPVPGKQALARLQGVVLRQYANHGPFCVRWGRVAASACLLSNLWQASAVHG